MDESAPELPDLTDDHEVDHSREDDVLWLFVRWVRDNSPRSTAVFDAAVEFVRWGEENEGRTRWYA